MEHRQRIHELVNKWISYLSLQSVSPRQLTHLATFVTKNYLRKNFISQLLNVFPFETVKKSTVFYIQFHLAKINGRVIGWMSSLINTPSSPFLREAQHLHSEIGTFDFSSGLPSHFLWFSDSGLSLNNSSTSGSSNTLLQREQLSSLFCEFSSKFSDFPLPTKAIALSSNVPWYFEYCKFQFLVHLWALTIDSGFLGLNLPSD